MARGLAEVEAGCQMSVGVGATRLQQEPQRNTTHDTISQDGLEERAMGYRTRFTGQFDLDKPLTLEQYNILTDFAETDHRKNELQGLPGAWCDWVPTRDGKAIKCANNDMSFYDFDEWLEWIIDHFLKPWGYTLNGTARWQGEEVGDTGTLSVRNNEVEMIKDEDAAEKLETIRDNFLAWAEQHQGNGISNEAMPRFREIMDALERLTGWE